MASMDKSRLQKLLCEMAFKSLWPSCPHHSVTRNFLKENKNFLCPLQCNTVTYEVSCAGEFYRDSDSEKISAIAFEKFLIFCQFDLEKLENNTFYIDKVCMYVYLLILKI